MDQLSEEERREAARKVIAFAATRAKLLVNGRLANDGKPLGLGNVGLVFLCEAGPDVEAPLKIALKLPWNEGGGAYGAWTAAAEFVASREAQKIGLPTLLFAPEVATTVIDPAAVGAEADACGDDLQLQLAQFHANLSRVGIPILEALQTRWQSEPRFLFALAGNVVTHMARLHGAYLAHADVKPDNFMFDPEATPSFIDGYVGGAFIDWGGTRTGHALKMALEGDPNKLNQARNESFAMCSKCRVCFGKDGPDDIYRWSHEKKRWYFDEQNCPQCTNTAPSYQLCEGMLGVQKGELMMLIHGYGPSELVTDGAYALALGLAKGVPRLENELQIYKDAFTEWRRLVDELLAVWDCPDKFDRVEYWRRTGGPAEQLLAVWRAGNAAWPQDETCSGDVVDRAKVMMKMEMDLQIQKLAG